MTWFAMDGTAVRNVGIPDRYIGLRISPDGTEALTFVDDAVGNRDIWRMELTRGVRNRVTVGQSGRLRDLVSGRPAHCVLRIGPSDTV